MFRSKCEELLGEQEWKWALSGGTDKQQPVMSSSDNLYRYRINFQNLTMRYSKFRCRLMCVIYIWHYCTCPVCWCNYKSNMNLNLYQAQLNFQASRHQRIYPEISIVLSHNIQLIFYIEFIAEPHFRIITA